MYHLRRHSRTRTSACGLYNGPRALVPYNFRKKIFFSPGFVCEACVDILKKEFDNDRAR